MTDPASIVSATWSAPITPSNRQPASTDVVIIGGGIVGVSTAWFLARAGISTVVCEKGHVAGEQSGRNWGWVRVQGRDPREIPMMLDSQRIWREMSATLGEDVGWAEGGCLFAARDSKDMQRLADWCTVARDYELPTRMVDSREMNKLVGGSAAQWQGALYTDLDGRAEPHLAAPAIARAAERAGATVLTGCAVRGLTTAAGRVAGVVTEFGEIRSSVVVCAAGAWTSMFCRSLGLDLPQLQVRGTVARLASGDLPLKGNLFDDKIGIRRRHDGGFTVAHGSILDHAIVPSTLRHSLKFLPALRKEAKSLRIRVGKTFLDELRQPRQWPLDAPSPFERERVLNPKPNTDVLHKLKRNLAEVFPTLAEQPIVEAWAGMVETTPDVVPVIGEEDSVPGFFVASGFSGHGFGLGPGAGRSIAALVRGDTPPVELDAFRRERFYDGSPIKPYTAI